MAQPQTLLEALTRSLRRCNVTTDAQADPVAILWTDPKHDWRSIAPLLLPLLPELVVYGDYSPHTRTGPALWLRCVVDRTLDQPEIPPGHIPILYLPGVGRQELRAGDECPWLLEPLIELMFRGTLWLQKNGRDWTLQAYLTSADGLGLDVSGDNATKAAMVGALSELATTSLSTLQGRRLDADDFNKLLVPDPVRDLLLWMGNPVVFQTHRNPEQWAALRSQWRAQFKFDPAKDGELTAAEKLASAKGPWAAGWERYEQSAQAFPGIPDLLRRAAPPQIGLGGLGVGQDHSHWPSHNDQQEQVLREQLQAIATKPHNEACRAIGALEQQHGARRSWIWAALGFAPLAQLLAPLALLAERASSPLAGSNPSDFIGPYTTSGWEADAAAWQAVAMATTANEALVREVVAALLRPWLDASARSFQAAVEAHPLPAATEQPLLSAEPGGCLLFADGLRFDTAQRLHERLEAMGLAGTLTTRWAGLPTVTATAKPAVSPVANQIKGTALAADFAPAFVSGRPCSAFELRKAIQALGYQILADNELDLLIGAESRGWLEIGDLDHKGHDLQDDLPKLIEGELERLALRIQKLLDLGWSSVRVVTDHGWLYCPGGLTKIELPGHLTDSKWSRCAVIKGNSQVQVPTAPWSWNSSEHFATPPGAACFNSGSLSSYAHGGISLQECLTPVLEISRGSAAGPAAAISSISWKRLRCFVEVSGAHQGFNADLRLEQASGPSVAQAAKPVESDGSVSLVLEDEDLDAAGLVVVLLGSDGRVIAQRRTRAGEDT